MTTYFTKSASNTWDWNVVDENNSVVYSSAAAGNALTFDTSGAQVSGGTATLGPLTLGTGTAAQTINFALENTTQFANDSQVISQTQNGYGAGNLTNITIDNEGNVLAKYSNGEEIKVSRIVLAKFSNFSGLQKEGASLFSATGDSGPPRIGVPGTELGNIFTNALEQSTVDLAAEFVKMITTQAWFSGQLQGHHHDR